MTVTAHQPAVSAKGKAALDEVLAQHVASGKIPAVTFGATTADGPIYFAAKGERVLGEPDKGEIDDKTSECLCARWAGSFGSGRVLAGTR